MFRGRKMQRLRFGSKRFHMENSSILQVLNPLLMAQMSNPKSGSSRPTITRSLFDSQTADENWTPSLLDENSRLFFKVGTKIHPLQSKVD